MKCQACDEQAIHHVTELVAGEFVEYHVCNSHMETLDKLGFEAVTKRKNKGFNAFWEDPELPKAMQNADALEKMAAYLLPALCLALLDPQAEVRIMATLHLMHLGPKAKTAIQALRNALLDEDERVRKAAEIAIESIETERAW